MAFRTEHHPPHYYAPDCCYFLTATTVSRQPVLQIGANRTLLRDAIKDALVCSGVTLYAWVVLTDHYHLLLRTGESTSVGRFIKGLHSDSASRLNRADGAPGRQVWYQYWDRTPRDEDEFWAYFNYIHINPIKHKCVQTPWQGWMPATSRWK